MMKRFGAAIPTIDIEASPNPSGLNPNVTNVTVERNSVGIAAPGDSGPRPLKRTKQEINSFHVGTVVVD
jgi:hypothetical protein